MTELGAIKRGNETTVHQDKVRRESADSKARKDAQVAAVGAAILRGQFEEMRSNQEGALLGEDAEPLHQMRVATRRLRAGLRLFVGDELRDTFAPSAAAAREIGQALGAVRDLDVLRADLQARAAAVPADAPALEVLIAALDRVRAERREQLRVVLAGPAVEQFWTAFPTAVDALERSTHQHKVRSAAPRLLRRHLRKVLRAGDALQAPTSSELHQVRIRGKRLRYATEFFKPWFERRLAPIIEVLTDLQDTLGTLHDIDVGPASLRLLLDVAALDSTSGPVNSSELARTALALVQERQQRRDELLIRFRDQWAELGKRVRQTKLFTRKRSG